MVRGVRRAHASGARGKRTSCLGILRVHRLASQARMLQRGYLFSLNFLASMYSVLRMATHTSRQQADRAVSRKAAQLLTLQRNAVCRAMHGCARIAPRVRVSGVPSHSTQTNNLRESPCSRPPACGASSPRPSARRSSRRRRGSGRTACTSCGTPLWRRRTAARRSAARGAPRLRRRVH
jgi:hypothetical protein